MAKKTVRVKLTGEDGNSFAVMARVLQGLRKAGASEEDLTKARERMTSGNSDRLLVSAMDLLDEHGIEWS